MRKYWNTRNVGERTYKRWPAADLCSKFIMKAASAPAHTPEASSWTVRAAICIKLLTAYLLFHQVITARGFERFCLMC